MMCPTMMGPPVGCGKAAFLLVALALGYWVLTLADNQADRLKLIGRITGWLVMVVAVGGLLCSAFAGMCGRKKMCATPGAMMGGCPMHKAAMMNHGGAAPEPEAK